MVGEVMPPGWELTMSARAQGICHGTEGELSTAAKLVGARLSRLQTVTYSVSGFRDVAF
jgi:hypothetical protein